MLKYNIYVNDALEMISRIEKFGVKDNLENWDATLMRLQVIGESVKKIPSSVKSKHKDINWGKFEDLRNFISHVYARVPRKMIIQIVNEEIPKLKEKLLIIKKETK